jgi:UDP-galactopyranose mutase
MIMQPLVALSHVRWAFVRQRPHHLLSRLAGWYDIEFIEEPVFAEGSARLLVRHVSPGVTVLIPHTPVPDPGFNDRQMPYLRALLSGAVAREHRLNGAITWLTTPTARSLAEMLDPSLVVYDCMEEPARLAGASPDQCDPEAALLEQADLVFTAGPSLYDKRRHRHPRVHCLPSAVDVAHFAPSGLDPDELQADQAAALQGGLPSPRLGFFGVIDDRVDLDLLAGVADARPAWQIVMVGPVQIDPGRLPRRPNIHWLGLQPYARLPYLLAGWDVALLPYLINEATAAINPTKTLEYLAGEKPVVSTPVRDVKLLYGDVVRLASGVMEFVAACEDTLAETPHQRSRRAMEMLTTVSTQSWDRTAATVHRMIEEVRAQRREETAEDGEAEVPVGFHAAGRRAGSSAQRTAR